MWKSARSIPKTELSFFTSYLLHRTGWFLPGLPGTMPFGKAFRRTIMQLMAKMLLILP